jgi:hypothetical protein
VLTDAFQKLDQETCAGIALELVELPERALQAVGTLGLDDQSIGPFIGQLTMMITGDYDVIGSRTRMLWRKSKNDWVYCSTFAANISTEPEYILARATISLLRNDTLIEVSARR